MTPEQMYQHVRRWLLANRGRGMGGLGFLPPRPYQLRPDDQERPRQRRRRVADSSSRFPGGMFPAVLVPGVPGELPGAAPGGGGGGGGGGTGNPPVENVFGFGGLASYITDDRGGIPEFVPLSLASYPIPGFSDDFEDGVINPAWVQRDGTWAEAGGQLGLTASSGMFGGALRLSGYTFDSFIASCNVVNPVLSMGLFFGFDFSTDSGWMAWFDENVTELYRHDSASWTLVASGDPILAGVVTITRTGTNVVINAKGTDVLTYAGAVAYPSGEVGIFADTAGASLADFSIVPA